MWRRPLHYRPIPRNNSKKLIVAERVGMVTSGDGFLGSEYAMPIPDSTPAVLCRVWDKHGTLQTVFFFSEPQAGMCNSTIYKIVQINTYMLATATEPTSGYLPADIYCRILFQRMKTNCSTVDISVSNWSILLILQSNFGVAPQSDQNKVCGADLHGEYNGIKFMPIYICLLIHIFFI